MASKCYTQVGGAIWEIVTTTSTHIPVGVSSQMREAIGSSLDRVGLRCLNEVIESYIIEEYKRIIDRDGEIKGF